MRYAAFTALMAVSLWGAGCGSESAARTDGPAGEVVALSGSATATRGNTTRDLEVGAKIFADDTLETAAGAELSVTLSHNGAFWTMTGGQKRRVDSSKAWTAEKQSGTGLGSTDENRTGAAGRHTERQAGESRRSVESSAKTAKSPEPTPAAVTANETADQGQTPPDADSKQTDSESSSRRRDEKTTGILNKAKGGGDPAAGFIGTEQRKKTRPKKYRIETVKVTVTGGLDAQTARRSVMRGNKALERCAEHATEGVSVTAELVVSDSGKVVKAKAIGGGAKFQTCVAAILRRQNFPSADGSTAVRVTIVLVAK